MQYTIIDPEELVSLFEEARIQLQQSCLETGQKTDISSMQENVTFLQVIATYLIRHSLHLRNKQLLIDELAHCFRSAISLDNLLPEKDYKTMLEILLRG